MAVRLFETRDETGWRVDLEATIRIGDRVLCDEGDAWAEIRAILIDSAAGTLERLVIEPPHMVGVGQFAPADRLSFSDGVLSLDGYRAVFDGNLRAETQQWVPPQSQGVGTIKGVLIPVEGLTTLDGSTKVVDRYHQQVGTLVGVQVQSGRNVRNFVVRISGRLRHRDVLVAREREVVDLDTVLCLNVEEDDLRRKPRT